jgi:hypothetical protein
VNHRYKNAEQDSGYKAKYLILLSDHGAQRALLFGMDHRYLTEVIEDDGLVLENLTRFGTVCAPPQDIECDALILIGGQPSDVKVKCFSLG